MRVIAILSIILIALSIILNIKNIAEAKTTCDRIGTTIIILLEVFILYVLYWFIKFI